MAGHGMKACSKAGAGTCQRAAPAAEAQGIGTGSNWAAGRHAWISSVHQWARTHGDPAEQMAGGGLAAGAWQVLCPPCPPRCDRRVWEPPPSPHSCEWSGCSSSTGRLECATQYSDTEPSSSFSMGPLSCAATTSGSAPSSAAFLQTALPMCRDLGSIGGREGGMGTCVRGRRPDELVC